MDYIDKVFNTSCLDLMSRMKEDNFKVDIIITDPPYGVDFNYDIYEDTFEKWQDLMLNFIPLAMEISKTSVIFPSGKFEGEKWLYKNFNPLWRICWYKGASSIRGPIGWQDWETLLVFGKKPVKNLHDFFIASPNRHNMEDIFKDHPSPKPLSWSKWLIERTTKEEDIVFDPFCGSGSMLASAKLLNRRYIGSDISKKYCNLSNKILEITQTKIIQKSRNIKLF